MRMKKGTDSYSGSSSGPKMKKSGGKTSADNSMSNGATTIHTKAMKRRPRKAVGPQPERY